MKKQWFCEGIDAKTVFFRQFAEFGVGTEQGFNEVKGKLENLPLSF